MQAAETPAPQLNSDAGRRSTGIFFLKNKKYFRESRSHILNRLNAAPHCIGRLTRLLLQELSCRNNLLIQCKKYTRGYIFCKSIMIRIEILLSRNNLLIMAISSHSISKVFNISCKESLLVAAFPTEMEIVLINEDQVQRSSRPSLFLSHHQVTSK